uniref:Uncharacterized protein n=1 Tax=Arundo donax TaxID=35708 RepID=A0A0A9A1N7_ARUDO
MKIQRPSLIN